jgi:hypothetical protein
LGLEARSTGRFTAPAEASGDSYSRLVSFDLRHDYYDGAPGDGPGRCRDLALEPTPGTSARLARHGLLWRGRPDGLDIILGARQRTRLAEAFAKSAAEAPGSGAADMLRTLLGGPLLFTLRILDPRFLNVTVLPAHLGSGNAALCLSNRRSRPGPGEVAAIAIDGSREIPLEIAAYEWMLANSRELDEKDRAEAAEGRGDPRAARLPLAFVELLLAPPAEEPGRSVPEGPFAMTASGPGELTVAPVRYEIRFAARATRWLYVVADRSGNLVEGSLSVEDPASGEAAFKPTDPVLRIPGALGAYAFLSDEPVPLRQQPRRFVLKGTTRNAPRRVRSLVDPLPAPAADSPPRRGRDGAADVSEILVFV